MSIALCTGSFDPITFGHVDVVRRARDMFDEVIVGVARNAGKRYMFSDDERVALAREALQDLPDVTVELVDDLVAEFAKERGANAIVKGLRGAGDFDNELSMALLNRHLSGIETVFVIADPQYSHIASSFVKDIARYHGRIDDLVPECVARALREKVGTDE